MNQSTITDRCIQRLEPLTFGLPVTHVYNPLTYARSMHDLYWRRWGATPREVILLGMNPGPWGMAQTGIPFGEVGVVREWLELEAPIGRPDAEHPARPVLGLRCHRREVSGQRLWGWARGRYRTPERFFRRFLVVNYCPLCFLEAGGRNRTPDRLPVRERRPLIAICDQTLRERIRLLKPAFVLGLGRFATDRARTALTGLPLEVQQVLHPSPANPRANRGWAHEMDRAVDSLDR